MHSDTFILLINAVSRILTLTNILSQSQASFSRHIRKFHQDWMYPLDFLCLSNRKCLPDNRRIYRKPVERGSFIDEVPVFSKERRKMQRFGTAWHAFCSERGVSGVQPCGGRIS